MRPCTCLFVLLSVALAAACQEQTNRDLTRVPPPPAESQYDRPSPGEFSSASSSAMTTDEQMSEPAPADAGAQPGQVTFSQTESQPAARPAPKPETRIYTVKRGDTLYSIARREYGDAKRWVDIAKANGITNEKKISIGTRLVIPR